MLPPRVEIGDSVIFQKLNDEAVLLNMSNQQYFGLNDTGARMWDLLVTLGDTSEVVSRMEQDYAVPVDTLTADLEALVQELLDAGLLRQSSTI
jgi:hypothetical protein